MFGDTEENYSDNLRQVLTRFMEHEITFNPEKSVFNTKEVECLGHITIQDGIKPVTKKLEAIQQFKQPTSITELRSFLGMVQQLLKFSPKFSIPAEPLRDLLSSKGYVMAIIPKYLMI